MSKKKLDTSLGEPLTENPFAVLAGLKAPKLDESVDSQVNDELPENAKSAMRAVVRYQRKGRGGKEVTVVEKLELGADQMTTWCSDMKKALGCGGHVEKDIIVLAGDQRERLPALLKQKGIQKLTVS